MSDAMSEASSRATLTFCRTCRPAGAFPDAEPPGAALGRAAAALVRERGLSDVVTVKAVACLSACSHACSAVVTGEAKFAYVVGDLRPEHAEDLVTFAVAHAESADGVTPWRARPQVVRKQTIARVPPFGLAHALVEEPIEADETQAQPPSIT